MISLFLPSIVDIPKHEINVNVIPPSTGSNFTIHEIKSTSKFYNARLFFDIRNLPKKIRPLMVLFQELILSSFL